jgi:hypothetical protein
MKIATVIIADRTMMVLASAEASTLDEDLVQQAAQQLAGQRVAVGAEFVQLRVGVADGVTVEPLQGQQLPTGYVGVCGGD